MMKLLDSSLFECSFINLSSDNYIYHSNTFTFIYYEKNKYKLQIKNLNPLKRSNSQKF